VILGGIYTDIPPRRYAPGLKLLFMLHLLRNSHTEYLTHLMHIKYTRLVVCTV